MGTYGGDEVNAVVLDVGTFSLRAGFAGQDTPMYVVPSLVGYSPSGTPGDVIGESVTNQPKQQKRLMGTNQLGFPRESVEYRRPIKDGVVDDWDAYEQLLDHVLVDRLRVQSGDDGSPLLFSESAWASRAQRERIAELVFEKYKQPALYICKAPVLTAFSAGRGTSLVLDVGHGMASASPVYDGLILQRSCCRERLAGGQVSDLVEKMLAEAEVDAVPQYRVAAKEAVGERKPAQFTERKWPCAVSGAFDTYQRRLIAHDVKSTVCQVAESQAAVASLTHMPAVQYEFPNGYHRGFGVERFRPGEALFTPEEFAGLSAGGDGGGGGGDGGAPVKMEVDGDRAAAAADGKEEDKEEDSGPSGAAEEKLIGLHRLAMLAISKCDVDLRHAMFQSVLVTGGTTKIPGFLERLQAELYTLAPQGVKLKVLQPPERDYPAWVGGSILASLGTAQQMWISRKEYEESGKSLIDKKVW